jgi:hypothetical protein
MIAKDGKIFTPKDESLSHLLGDIYDGKTVLPDFQRPWVWDPNMIRELIISIAYRYPAGSLLTMPVGSKKNFATRSFEGAKVHSGETEKPKFIVLDGQQRLTSMLQAAYTSDGVLYKNKRYFFYLDIPKLMADTDGIEVGDPYFDDALFYLMEGKKNSRRIRYKGLEEIYDITEDDATVKHGALPLWYVFDSRGLLSKWKDRYLMGLSGEHMGKFRELLNQWEDLVDPWIHRIKTYPFPIVELHEDMPIEAVCHIFEKVNSSGKPLDVFDLCTAILWSQGFRLNHEWQKMKTDLGDKLEMQPLNGTSFLMGIALLDSLHRKKNRPEERIAVTCKRSSLMELNKKMVDEWWEVLKKGYVESGKFMADQGIVNPGILPFTTMIIPLSAILAHIVEKDGEAHVGKAWEKLAKWYWCSVFSQRYSSQVDTNSAMDYEQVVDWIYGGDEPPVVKKFSFRSDMIQEVASIRNAVYKGILCLLVKNGAKDFGGAGTINSSLYVSAAHDHHHIFPKNAMKKLGIKDPRVESIVNKTLINASVNRSIGDNRPSVYLMKLKTGKMKLEDEKLDRILESHLIPPDSLKADDWENFIKQRREKIRGLIESTCGGSFLPFSESADALDVETEEEDDDEGAAEADDNPRDDGNDSGEVPSIEEKIKYFRNEQVKELFLKALEELKSKKIDVIPIHDLWISCWYRGKRFMYLGPKRDFFSGEVQNPDGKWTGRIRIADRKGWDDLLGTYIQRYIEFMDGKS